MSDDGSLFHMTLERVFAENDQLVRDQQASDRRIEKLQQQLAQKRCVDPEQIVYQRYDPPRSSAKSPPFLSNKARGTIG